MVSNKFIVVNVEKGLILQVDRDNDREIYLTIRKAKEEEVQEKIEGHHGYKDGEVIRYFFE